MRPNICYLHSHDTGRMVGPYGAAAPTPLLQRFAAEGVVFRQAFSAAPTCTPSRAALLTGQAPHSAGVLGLAHRGFTLADPRQHLVNTLRGAGYKSAMAGSEHVVQGPDEGPAVGYDEQLGTDGRDAAALATAAAEYLRRDHDQPFLLSVGFFEIHSHGPGAEHLFGHPPEDERFVGPPPTLPDGPTTRADVASFLGAARALDSAIGEILDVLDETGLTEETLVIITTDHGVALPGMKGTLSDLGTGVMLMMRGPEPFRGGKVRDALVSQVDILPTLCELLGVESPHWVQGTSLLPVVIDDTEVNDAVFSEVTYHAAYEPQRAIRTRRWKYILRFGGRRNPVVANVDDSPSKERWLDVGWHRQKLDQERLHDLLLDPAEGENLAQLETHRHVREELAGRLRTWMEQTADPLLAGPVPTPDGARVVSPDRISAARPGNVERSQPPHEQPYSETDSDRDELATAAPEGRELQ